MANSAYLGRHNQVAKIIHLELAQKYNLIANPLPYYKYNPEAVLENATYILYWDRPVQTDRTVDYNRPDLLLIDKVNKKAIIIEVAVPLCHNLETTERHKITKYENLAYDLRHTWQLNEVTTVPIVMSSTGVATTRPRLNIRKLDLLAYIISSTVQKAI